MKRHLFLPLLAAAMLAHPCVSVPTAPDAQQPPGGQPQVVPPQGGQPPAKTPPQTLPVPFTPLPGHGAPLVYARINGKEAATFLVDTGANTNLISESLVARLGLKTHPALEGDGTPRKPFGTPANSVDVPLITLSVARGTANNTLDVNLTNDASSFVVAPPEQLQIFIVDGILGVSFLKQEAVSFDFVTHSMGLTYPGALSLDQVRALGFGGGDGAILPLTPCNGNLVSVPATLSDGRSSRRVDLVVDTGGVSTLIPLSTARELSLKSAGTAQITGGSSGHKVLGQVELPSLSLGGLQLTNLTVSTTGTLATPTPTEAGEDPPAHLGMDLLKNYRILIDYPASVMYLQPNTTEESLPQPTTRK